VTALMENGELKPAILEQANYRIFLFSYTNLLTTWLMNLEIYDIDKPYLEMKPIYLQGIFSVYQPYLTAKGKRSLRNAGLEIS
jgi:hypothetical protein